MKHLLLLACTMPLVAMENFEVGKAVIPTANKLSALSAINKNGRLDYSIADRSVQRCDIYGPLKEISSEEQLNGFLANGGKIKLSKMSNGEYVLRSGVDIKGGGPILAVITYAGIKFLGSTAPMVIVPAIAGGILDGASINPDQTNRSATSTAIVGTVSGAALATATAIGVSTGYVAAVESAAVYAATCALAVPFL